MDTQQGEAMMVRRMVAADAPAVAHLHMSQIDRGFLSSLGHGLLTSIYRALPRCRSGFGFVAERNGQVIGFITCAGDLNRLYRSMIFRRGLWIGLRVLPRAIRPSMLRKVWETLWYPTKVDRPELPTPEVLSVVTSPEARGGGVGSKLMTTALAEFKKRGCLLVKVLVGADLGPANAYYQRNGFRLACTIQHHQRAENVYVHDMEAPAAGGAAIAVASPPADAAFANAMVSEIAFPALGFRNCSVREHCLALRAIRRLPFWWYLGASRMFGVFSIPFQGRNGYWWYQVKPGLCWPVDFFAPIDRDVAHPALRKTFHGYQHVVPAPEQANSRLVINAIMDVPAYDSRSIDSKRRNAVRKGLKSCTFDLLVAYDRGTFDECRMAWDDLHVRTGWKEAADARAFDAGWRDLLDCPGVSILVGRDQASGQVAGFLITKIIGETAYVDTIASRTALLKSNVNDALVYTFVMNTRRLAGVTKVHFAIRSYVESLEKFKRDLGFAPVPLPAYTRLRWPTRLVLSSLYPRAYKRMRGEFEPATPDSQAQPPTPPPNE